LWAQTVFDKQFHFVFILVSQGVGFAMKKNRLMDGKFGCWRLTCWIVAALQ